MLKPFSLAQLWWDWWRHTSLITCSPLIGWFLELKLTEVNVDESVISIDQYWSVLTAATLQCLCLLLLIETESNEPIRGQSWLWQLEAFILKFDEPAKYCNKLTDVLLMSYWCVIDESLMCYWCVIDVLCGLSSQCSRLFNSFKCETKK